MVDRGDKSWRVLGSGGGSWGWQGGNPRCAPPSLTSHLPGAALDPQGCGFVPESVEEGPGVEPAFILQTWAGKHVWGDYSVTPPIHTLWRGLDLP